MGASDASLWLRLSNTETLRLPDIQAYGASTEAPTIGAKGVIGEAAGSEQASLSPTLIAPGGITVGATDLPTTKAEAARATPGNAGSGTAPPTVKLDLKAQAQTLAQQPGLAWLGDLAQREDVDWQQIALIHDQWDYKHSGLTQEGAAVIAIAVAIVTWGSASSAGVAVAEGAGMTTAAGAAGASTVAASTAGTVLTTTGATVATATAAGITTLASQAAVSLINNKGDIGQTLKDLGSSDSVKQLVSSMLTAGLTQGATQYLQNEGLLVKNLGNASFTERFATYTTKAVVGAGVQSAVMGRPLDETLKMALVNSLAQTLTSEIGDWGKGSETQVAKTLAHAVVQCAAASVQGGDCGSAALGAATAELLSPLLDGLDARTQEAGFQQTLGSAIAGMSAMLVAELTGKDALTVMNAAQMVDVYNRQLHPWEKDLAKELARKSEGKFTEEEIADALRWASNAELNETASSNIVVQLTPGTQAGEIFDAQSMSLDASGGQAVLYQDLSRITPPGGELMAFIQQNTGDTYSWNTAAWQAVPQATFSQNGTRYGVFSANGQTFKLPLADCPAAGCATSPIAWASTSPADQAVLQAYATAAGVEMTSFVSRTAGIVGSTATTAAATPGPHQPVAAGTAIVAQTIGLAADAVESYITRDSAKLVESAFYAYMLQKRVDDLIPLAAPITNEVIEAWKASGTRQEIGAWAQQHWIEFRAAWGEK